MSVDYYSCKKCGHNFPDCGEYFTCSSCETMYCCDECGDREDEGEWDDGVDDKTTCAKCRGEWLPDCDILKFCLERLGLSRAQAEMMAILEAKGS